MWLCLWWLGNILGWYNIITVQSDLHKVGIRFQFVIESEQKEWKSEAQLESVSTAATS